MQGRGQRRTRRSRPNNQAIPLAFHRHAPYFLPVSLLHIAPPTHVLPPETLDTPGGFAWWYADILDDDGNGVVAIWSYGLPFLPGYAAAARAGAPQIPRTRPSINVSVYRDRRMVCYLLQEFPEGASTWDGDEWRFGDTTVTSTSKDGRRVLSIDLDCPLPATVERLRGRIEIAGAERSASNDAAWGGLHDWSLLTAGAAGRCELRVGAERFVVQGRGYHDCNGGRVPLHDTGIREWTWGRLPSAGGTDRIYYVLWPNDGPPEAHGYAFGHDGAFTRVPIDVSVERSGRGRAGLTHPMRLVMRHDGHLWLDVSTDGVVDDGPFYVRHFVRSATGELGLGEFCRPDRVDLAMHRPLVRMRVHCVGGENSMWLPLFTGPRRGRLSRLLAQWRP